ncbi:hypothetical protein AVEN_274644-1 [Araneus ventricosus]|uniref:Uncharacterized protein n=1 Tax=Araneus ventricosus TaxID=182803 RepID=A0A4Y2FC83_ARAVE|nr:hypothetical protein AVEN_274644-1 [Araneus ventricosus]
MRSCHISKQVLASPDGTITVMELLGPTFDDRSYPEGNYEERVPESINGMNIAINPQKFRACFCCRATADVTVLSLTCVSPYKEKASTGINLTSEGFFISCV